MAMTTTDNTASPLSFRRQAMHRQPHHVIIPANQIDLKGTERDSDYEFRTMYALESEISYCSTSNCGALILLQAQLTSIHNPHSQNAASIERSDQLLL